MRDPEGARLAQDPALLPMVDPAGESGMLAVFRRKYLLRLIVRRELNARYSGSFLGMIWSYVNPLVEFGIYWFVMGKIMGMSKGTESFAVHIFAALIATHFFTEAFSAGTRSIMTNTDFVKKMALPLEMFPVSSVVVTLYNVAPAMPILLVFCVGSGWRPDLVGVAAFALALAILICFATGCALFFSVLEVLYRDTGQLVGILNNLFRFAVPMIYPFTLVTQNFPGYVNLYLLNPLADAVLLMQRAFWLGTTDDPAAVEAVHFPANLFVHGAIGLAISIAVLLLGQLVFSRLQGKVPERV